jgi:hypothetical protein
MSLNPAMPKRYAPEAVYLGAVVVVAAFALAAACGHPLLPRWTGLAWTTAAGVPAPVIAAWVVTFTLLGLAITHPLFGLAGYLLCAYSIQGTEPSYQMLYREGGLHWAALLAVAAGVIFQLRHDSRLRFPRDPLALAVAAFLAWVAVCYLVAQIAGRDAPPRWNREPVYFLHCFVVFWLTSSFVRGREQLAALIGLIAAVLAFRWLTSPVVVFNESYLASYFALACPLVLALSLMFDKLVVRIVWILAALAMIGLILHIQNRAAVVAVIVAMFIFVLLSLSRLRATILGIALVIIVVFGLPRTEVWERFDALRDHLSPGTERVALWYGGVAMFREYPVFGVGPGQYSSAVPLYTDGIGRGGQPDAHNSFIEVLAETGAVGLLLFCWMLLVALGYAYQVTASRNARDWVRGAARGLFASLCAVIVFSMLNSRHDLTLLYVVFGMACGVRACWFDRRLSAA